MEGMNESEERKEEIVLFENKTLIGREENAAFQKYAVKRQLGKFRYIGTVAFAVLGAMFLAVQDYFLGAVMLALAAVYLFLPLILGKIAAKKKNVPDVIIDGIEEHYRAYEDRIEVSSASGGATVATNVVLYPHIREARVNGNYIYLYISKVQAHILVSTGFLTGNAPDFLSFLEKKGVKVCYR